MISDDDSVQLQRSFVCVKVPSTNKKEEALSLQRTVRADFVIDSTQALRERADEEGIQVAIVSAKVESELMELPQEEAKASLFASPLLKHVL